MRIASLALLAVNILYAQTPSFSGYPITAPKFTGKPAAPVLKTAYDRQFRTMIRESAEHGPNFAGHYTVAEWGCGAGCVSVVIVDAVNGAVHRGPFRNLGWELRKYEGIPSNGDQFKQLEYRLDSRLFIARGCPEETNCGSYFWEWNGSHFKLLRRIESTPLPSQ